MAVDPKWTMSNIPPEGDPELGMFVYERYLEAKKEKERLKLPDRWLENFRLMRGRHWLNKTTHPTVNLIFANIERTVASLVSRNPQAEVVVTDGIEDTPGYEADKLMNKLVGDWWTGSEQIVVLTKSIFNMEVYGPTIEKAVVVDTGKRVDANGERIPVLDFKIVPMDPYAAFPEPGNFNDISTDCRFFGHAYPVMIDEVRSVYDISEDQSIQPDDTYNVLGRDREHYIPSAAENTPPGSVTYSDGSRNLVNFPAEAPDGVGKGKTLLIEMWLRDDREETYVVEEVEHVNPVSGAITYEKIMGKRKKYPDGIRKVTVCDSGKLVLDDMKNPNLNYAMSADVAENCHAWGRFPFYMETSYKDNFILWGFSNIEQTGMLNLVIDEIFAAMIHYIKTCLKPPLINPKDTGIANSKLSNRAGLVLNPLNFQVAKGLRFMDVPSLPNDFYRLISLAMSFLDRISATEDADRGEAPGSIQSGVGVVALQARNKIVMGHKVRAVSHLIRERGRWAINFFQNFGYLTETMKTGEEKVLFRGTQFAGRLFNYTVEEGSTMPRTEAQLKADALTMYQLGINDRQDVFEKHEWPGWKEIIERVGEGQLNQALQILMQAGLPQEVAQQLKEQLMLTQGGPGNTQQSQPGVAEVAPGAPQPGVGPPPPDEVQQQTQRGEQ
jgi:hypothetical protein